PRRRPCQVSKTFYGKLGADVRLNPYGLCRHMQSWSTVNTVAVHQRNGWLFQLLRPEDLVSRAKELEQPAIALVDRDGVYGAPRLHMAAKSVGIQPHVGAELSVEGFGNLARPPPG